MEKDIAKECRQITTFIVDDNNGSNNNWVYPHRVGPKND